MRRLIAVETTDEFTVAIDYIKQQLASMNLFETPTNEDKQDESFVYTCNLKFNQNLLNAFIITGVGRKFDELINTVKNQYNLKISFQMLTDNTGLYVQIEGVEQ